MTFNTKKKKPFNSILQYLPRLRGSRKSEDASGSLGDKIVSNKCSKRNAIVWGSPRSILPLRRFTSPTRGPTPLWTMALMYMKGFASFTEKGNDEQKLLLRVLGTGTRHYPWGKKRKAKGQKPWGDMEPRCVHNGVFWLCPGKHYPGRSPVCVTFIRAVLWMCKYVLPELCIQLAYKQLLVFCSIHRLGLMSFIKRELTWGQELLFLLWFPTTTW